MTPLDWLQQTPARILRRLPALQPDETAVLMTKVIAIHIPELATTWFLYAHGEGWTLADDPVADLTISGSIPALLAAAIPGSSPGAVQLSGDLALAGPLQGYMQRLPRHWLARHFLARFALGASRTTVVTALDGLRHYPRDCLAHGGEVDRFSQEIDTLVLAVDRLEARLQRLQRQRRES